MRRPQAQFRVTTRGSNQAQVRAAAGPGGPGTGRAGQAQEGGDRRRSAKSPRRRWTRPRSPWSRRSVGSKMRSLIAPWDGVVTAVNIVEGTLAAPSTPAIQLADNSRYHIDVQVDEADIASIAENQPVEIELDALPAQKLGGHVDRVAPSATASANGVIAYPGHGLRSIPTDTPLRSGMSATSTITSDSRTNVLLIPNRAVQIERESGQHLCRTAE